MIVELVRPDRVPESRLAIFKDWKAAQAVA
jgi:hypothetical protein